MNLHSRARTCPQSRELIYRRVRVEGCSVKEVAAALGVSRQTVAKWLKRHEEEGRPGLVDRSSRPVRSPRRTGEARRRLALRLRQDKKTGMEIARCLRMPRSTAARILSQAGLGRLKYLDPPPVVVRYEKHLPGQLLHLDTKKLARIKGVGHRITHDRSRRVRGVGWEYAHVAVDDASRLSHVEVLDSETAQAVVFFLHKALSFYRQLGIRVRAVMTDNAKAYTSHLFRATCQRYRIRHLTIKPYRPQTNGKAERFIQTLIRRWAYARPYTSSRSRTAALPRWLWTYNYRRPHASLGYRPPITRLRTPGEQRA